MCLRPKTWWTKDGDAITIACQECRQCLDLIVHGWVGRNIAESKTSLKAHFVTLTYGRDEFGNEDHPRAKVLTYSDPQKWFKLMRYHGYPCRYFLSGEYGPSKGRTHWHFIVYWLDRVPAWSGYDMNGRWGLNHISRGENKVKFMHHRVDENGKPALVRGEPSLWWPHGWTQVSEGATVRDIQYVCKYIRKPEADGMGKQSQFMMSKQPPLGAAYFQQRAERYVAAGLAPQGGMGYLEGRLEHGMGGYKYSWSDVTYVDKAGVRQIHEFQLRGVSLEMFLTRYVACWETVWPGRPIPASKLVQEFLEPGIWKGTPLADPQADFRFERWVENQDAIAAIRSKAVEADPMLPARERALARRRSQPRGMFHSEHLDALAFPSEFEALRRQFEARARQIAFHRSENARGTKKF